MSGFGSAPCALPTAPSSKPRSTARQSTLLPASKRRMGIQRSGGSDADSTSLAILFLAALGATKAPADAYVALRRHQRDDGGAFRPSFPMGLWGLGAPLIPRSPQSPSSPSGPAPVLMAADGAFFGVHTAVAPPRRAVGRLLVGEPLPACEADLACLAAVGRPEAPPEPLGRLTPEDPLQTALRRSRFPPPARGAARLLSLADWLIAAQLEDGSWQKSPPSCIPSRSCLRPWEAPGARPALFRSGRLFTTRDGGGGASGRRAELASTWADDIKVKLARTRRQPRSWAGGTLRSGREIRRLADRQSFLSAAVADQFAHDSQSGRDADADLGLIRCADGL